MDKTRRLRCLIACLTALCLAGCSDDGLEGGADEGGGGVYLRFTLSVEGADGATKADGDEPGEEPDEELTDDDLERATEAEYRVNDLLVFLVPHTTVEDEKDLPLTKVYFDRLQGPAEGNLAEGVDRWYTQTRKVDGLKAGDEYHIMALANVGSDWETRCSFHKLDDLFKAVCEDTAAWLKTDGRGFLMSSTEYMDKIFTVTANSSEQYPIDTKPIRLRRLLARVDYQANESYITPNPQATDPDQFTGTVRITGAALVNRLEKGEYLFRRVSDDNVDDTDGADLWTAANIYNHIVDPYPTGDKDATYFGNYFETFTQQADWRGLLSEGAEVTDRDGTKWQRIGYAGENTNLIQSLDDLQRYATGVVFEAKFVPNKVRDESGQEADYTANADFFRYNGRLYKTYAAIKKDFHNLPEAEPQDPSKYGVDKYAKGICYYTWWIKHNEDGDPDAFGPMEYAVARNNLYQLTVASVAGLGDPEPGTASLVVKVAVRPWTALPKQDITMEEDDDKKETYTHTHAYGK